MRESVQYETRYKISVHCNINFKSICRLYTDIMLSVEEEEGEEKRHWVTLQ